MTTVVPMSDDKPLNGAIGNTEDDRRGRGIGDRPSKNVAQTPKSDGSPSRTIDDADTDGYPIGGDAR